ncbi:MAG: hypothetical protein IKG97_07270 [Lachnospiraceae bacterium]|nr:hypothetical protein [Lachnospiraceae bacterium]
MILCLLILVFLTVLFILGRGEERDFLKSAKKRLKIPVFAGSAGLYFSRKLKRVFALSGEERLLERKDEELIGKARIFGIALMVSFAGAILGFFLGLSNRVPRIYTEIARPEFGEVKEVPVVVKGLSKEEEMTISVPGRDPGENEYEEIFDDAYEAMRPVMLGGNESFEEVTERLVFRSENDAGIQFSYRSSRNEVLSDYGTLDTEDLEEGGEDVLLTVTLSYKDYEKTYEQPVHVMKKNAAGSDREALISAIEKADSDSIRDQEMKLPEEVLGREVFFEGRRTSVYAVLGVFVLAAAAVLVVWRERRKEKIKKRDEEMAFSYAQLLGKFRSLLTAGMTTRSAWEKITGDYLKRRKREGRKYVYEEMLISVNQLRSGMSEREVYTDFGRRTGQHRYVRFAGLLSQNLRQGISGLTGALDTEMHAALEERKNMAIRKGEEAGTKLLFPMMVMLVVIVICIAVPAFMSF